MTDIRSLRTEYEREPLLESALHESPIEQFRAWFDAAVAHVPEPNAVALATADGDGQPSARMVLLKGFNDEGFDFFTNYGSRKAQALAANPRASLLFWWQPLAWQVRIEGKVRRVPEYECDEYFRKRPRGSKIGAWASPQSQILADRGQLERAVAEIGRRFEDREIPRPENWGGYRLVPEVFEFWQGREDRLHDRLAYRRSETGWAIVRLAP